MTAAETTAASETPRSRGWDRARYWLGQAARFAGWQGASQLLQMLIGLCMVRWLDYEDYAVYGLVASFQNVMISLMDLGYGEAVLALVGGQVENRATIGSYVEAATSHRWAMYSLLAPLSGLAFFEAARRHHWPWAWVASLFLTILLYLYCQGWCAIFSPVLLMHRKMSGFFRPRVIVSLGVLAAAALLHRAGHLGATAMCWMNVAGVATMGLLYRKESRAYFTWPERPDPTARRAIRAYISPLIAGIVFYAFHGQIQIFFMSYFGGTRSLAEVSALGRIGQILMFASAFTATVLVPILARAPSASLGRSYTRALLLVLAIGGAMLAAALLWPGAFLFLLGPKYAGLQSELLLSVMGSVATLLAGALYMFNNARRWTRHGTTTATIAGVLLIDLGFILWADLHQVRTVLLLSLATSAFPILPIAWTAWAGFRQEPREASAGIETPPALALSEEAI